MSEKTGRGDDPEALDPDEGRIVYVPPGLLAQAAHAIRTDCWFEDATVDEIRREAAILRAVEQMGMTRQQAATRFADLERSTEPAARARAISERQFIRYVLRAIAERFSEPG
ncbi:MAG TPA: hypothetical protein VGN14_05905 [Candidatus Elarobacter sp.]